MPLLIESANQSTLELDEFVAIVEQRPGPLSNDDLVELADPFKALLNNKTFLERFFIQELANIERFQEENRQVGQAFQLHANPNFVIRAVLWAPNETIVANREISERQFSYDVMHDHNFSFLTGGYLGSGYKTDCWEYDRDACEPCVGSKIDLFNYQKLGLGLDEMMIYRESQDVHKQEEPRELSISLNLMTPSMLNREQILFASSTGEVRSLAGSPQMPIETALSLARYFPCDATFNAVERIAAGKNIDRRLRPAAKTALLEIAG